MALGKRKRGSSRPVKKSAYRKSKAAPYRMIDPKLVRHIVDRQIGRNIETKESVQQFTDGTEILHNNFVILTNNPLATLQGTSDPANTNTANRIGDTINLRGLSIKLMAELNERYSDVTFRLMVVKSARNDVPDRASLFVGQSGNKMLDKFNNERFSMLYQKWFKITSNPFQYTGAGASGAGYEVGSGTSSRATKIVKAWIPGKKFTRSGIIKYDNGGSDPKFFDYHVLLYAYSNFSTAQDLWAVARVNDCVTQIYYKDA